MQAVHSKGAPAEIQSHFALLFSDKLFQLFSTTEVFQGQLHNSIISVFPHNRNGCSVLPQCFVNMKQKCYIVTHLLYLTKLCPSAFVFTLCTRYVVHETQTIFVRCTLSSQFDRCRLKRFQAQKHTAASMALHTHAKL